MSLPAPTTPGAGIPAGREHHCADLISFLLARSAQPDAAPVLWRDAVLHHGHLHRAHQRAQGTVPNSADLSEVSQGVARICSSGLAGSALDLPPSSPDASAVPDPATPGRPLDAAGYAVDPPEIPKLCFVLAGTLADPRGTPMKAQPSDMNVVDVAPRYVRCALPQRLTCPPRPSPCPVRAQRRVATQPRISTAW